MTARAVSDEAQQILAATGVQGGLIVHLGCGDGKLTAALRANSGYLVQGLETDEAKVEAARRHVRDLKLYGPVSIQPWAGSTLPYNSNLVNLLVADNLEKAPMEEVMRVLAPQGVAYVKQSSKWTKSIKPRPENIDEWSHYLHDASGNAVAHDDLVGPPRGLQWVAEPRHTRSHEHIPSIYALVSSGGRIFYIADEGAIEGIRRPANWQLVARDAFNGVLLWKLPLSAWFPHIVNWGNTPTQLERKLVAVGDRVYVTLGLHAPLCAVDAATGKTLQKYDGSEGAEEIVLHRGALLLVIRRVTDQRVDELNKFAQLARLEKSPLYDRDTAQPLVKRFRASEDNADMAVLALDAETGGTLWKESGESVAKINTLTLCAESDRVFYQCAKEVVCRDLKTGQERWRTPAAKLRMVWQGNVICADGSGIAALSAETGQPRWQQESTMVDVRDVFVAAGSLWEGGFKPAPGKRSSAWGPYFVTQRDLATGQITRRIEPENPGHHHRCYQNKATDRYILGGRRGTEFIDLSGGDVLWNSWVRGVCKYGVMPCNGLFYAPPHACACYIAAKLTGFYALSAAGVKSAPAEGDEPRLKTGPAYATVAVGSASSDPEWPTYRHDAQRSGRASTSLPTGLRRDWQVNVGGRVTSPTIAHGKLLVASQEEHRVCALSADSGRMEWQFTAGARVDSPPTLHEGRAVFGCHDGCVYSLRTDDGALAWRLRVARRPQLAVDCGQLASCWPVAGSVTVQDGVAYCAAGRSSYLDGGIDLCGIEPRTGKIVSTTTIYSPDPQTDKQPPQSAPYLMPGALADILSADQSHVYLRDAVFDKQCRSRPEGAPHLFTLTGFLDDTWAHRSYWIFGKQCSINSGCGKREEGLIYGRLLVFDDAAVYGYGRAPVHWSNQLLDGPYRMFAANRDSGETLWEKRLPIEVRSLVLAGNVLFAAGQPVDTVFKESKRDLAQPGLLLAISAADGRVLSEQPLDAAPIVDGMAAAGGRLYVSLENGCVVCFGAD